MLWALKTLLLKLHFAHAARCRAFRLNFETSRAIKRPRCANGSAADFWRRSSKSGGDFTTHTAGCGRAASALMRGTLAAKKSKSTCFAAAGSAKMRQTHRRTASTGGPATRRAERPKPPAAYLALERDLLAVNKVGISLFPCPGNQRKAM